MLEIVFFFPDLQVWDVDKVDSICISNRIEVTTQLGFRSKICIATLEGIVK